MSTATLPTIPFTEADAENAWNEWKCNCGPAALAAILGLHLKDVRKAVAEVGFASKGYMSPTMMRDAIPLAGGRVVQHNGFRVGEPMPWPRHGLARIQWCGPWTEPGSNPRWAYRHTHWTASWKMQDDKVLLFDVNGGLQWLSVWERR